MKAHIIRIGPDWLRVPLLCLFEPYWFVEMMVRMSMPVAWGGHPNKRRFLEWDFYQFHFAVFWAAWDGLFVPE